MFKCRNCEEQFETPERKNIIAEDYLGISNMFPNTTRMDLFVCPCCGDDDLEELEQCEMCEEWYSSDDLHDTTEMINGGCGYCCEQCIEDAEMVEM